MRVLPSRFLSAVIRLGSAVAIALLSNCSAPPAPPRVDNLPMYGQPDIPRPTQLKQADEQFVANAIAEFGGNRRLASISFCGQADRYLAQGNLDYAMRRYNQAWLLDGTNYEVHRGFGRVTLANADFDAAVTHLKKALALCSEPTERPALLAELGTAYSSKARTLTDLPSLRASTFALANEAFEQSTSENPALADTWRRWAVSLAHEGRSTDAAEKSRRAQQLDSSSARS